MSRTKPLLVPLSEMTPGQFGDCFALLAERTKVATRAGGRPRGDSLLHPAAFRAARRSAAVMVWADGPHFEDCERHWQVGHCYKLRAVYGEHEKYGPQLDLQQIRPVTDADRADG